MDHSTPSDARPVFSLQAISFEEQQKRQRGPASFMPAGFDRYPAAKALVESMPVVGMEGEIGFSGDRFAVPRENYG